MNIFDACSKNDLAALRALIERGEDVNQWDEIFGETPLHRVSRLRKREAAALLIAAGADVNGLNEEEETPLHVACERGYSGIVRLLLQHGADAHIRNALDETALDKTLQRPAEQPSREEIIDLFRKHAPEAVMEAWCTGGPAR